MALMLPGLPQDGRDRDGIGILVWVEVWVLRFQELESFLASPCFLAPTILISSAATWTPTGDNYRGQT